MAETEAEKTPLLPGNGSHSQEGDEHHSKAEYGSSKRVRKHPVFSAFNGICQIITMFQKKKAVADPGFPRGAPSP